MDVIRVAELSTAYSFTVGGRPVIAVPATASWFRENWDLADELGHLAERHDAEGISGPEADRREAAANAFAADLLLPAETVTGVDWASTGDAELARLVWELGISADVLDRRLRTLLGQHRPAGSGRAEIAARMEEAARRRFPRSLREAHLERIASGAIGWATLAWMLGVDPAELEVDSPETPEVHLGDLAAALGL